MKDLRELARSILPSNRYGEVRDEVLEAVARYKERRYLDLSDRITLLFEDAVTVWFQIEEVLYMEGGEAPVDEVVKAYAPIVPRRGEISATLMANLYGEEELRTLLPKFAGIQDSLYFTLDGKEVKAAPIFPEDYAEDALPRSVHYLKAPLPDVEKLGVVLRHPAASISVRLDDAVVSAIRRSMTAEETNWASTTRT